jgi:hypothetical protein
MTDRPNNNPENSQIEGLTEDFRRSLNAIGPSISKQIDDHLAHTERIYAQLAEDRARWALELAAERNAKRAARREANRLERIRKRLVNPES